MRTHPIRTATAGALACAALAACTPADTGGGASGTDAPAPGATPGPASSGAPAASTSAVSPARPVRYVALGDSFAALGTASLPVDGPPDCQRAPDAYPADLATDPRIARTVVATCGGARTPHLTAAQHPDAPPQFDALTPDTGLVTLTLGGNDIGFGDIVRCVVSTGDGGAGAPCREEIGARVDDALGALGGRLDAAHSGIRALAPDARVVVTGYLPLVPATGGCAFTARMGDGDVAWVREVTTRVNDEVRAAAERAGAAFVLPADADAHSACAAPAERWTDFTGAETGSHPMHPTAAGHRAMAAAVAAAL